VKAHSHFSLRSPTQGPLSPLKSTLRGRRAHVRRAGPTSFFPSKCLLWRIPFMPVPLLLPEPLATVGADVLPFSSCPFFLPFRLREEGFFLSFSFPVDATLPRSPILTFAELPPLFTASNCAPRRAGGAGFATWEELDPVYRPSSAGSRATRASSTSSSNLTCS